MKRLEFDKLSIEDQVIEFNKMYETCKSKKKVCTEIGIGKTTINDRFKKIGYMLSEGVGYVKNTNTQFEGQTSLIEPINENKEHNMLDLEYKINDIVERQIKIQLEKYFQNHKDEQPKIKNEIKLDELCSGTAKYRTYGVYANISGMFDEYVDNHPRFSKVALTSQALLEFMRNHK